MDYLEPNSPRYDFFLTNRQFSVCCDLKDGYLKLVLMLIITPLPSDHINVFKCSCSLKGQCHGIFDPRFFINQPT
jgi:hypothetical protein